MVESYVHYYLTNLIISLKPHPEWCNDWKTFSYHTLARKLPPPTMENLGSTVELTMTDSEKDLGIWITNIIS